MSIALQPPQTDLILPTPANGDAWDHHTIHTHYFGFSVPSARIGAFIYLRCQPVFEMCGGGVCIYQGLDNPTPQDAAHLDYQNTMPWPTVRGDTIATANGLSIEFLEPGSKVRLTYSSPDGATSFDLVQSAVTPLVARGHVMPGEERHVQTRETRGGSEQFMHCVGTLLLAGKAYDVDCHPARDRSWSQVRSEDLAAVQTPPIAWSPMCFGADLAFNQVGFEPEDTGPAWLGLYDVPQQAPAHHFAWVFVDGEVREITHVRRRVLERHPTMYTATRQQIEAEDEAGVTHQFSGEAIAMCAVPAWPNLVAHDSVFRWEDGSGRSSYIVHQEMWLTDYQRAMKQRASAN